jgi:hypothetical protein
MLHTFSEGAEKPESKRNQMCSRCEVTFLVEVRVIVVLFNLRMSCIKHQRISNIKHKWDKDKHKLGCLCLDSKKKLLIFLCVLRWYCHGCFDEQEYISDINKFYAEI